MRCAAGAAVLAASLLAGAARAAESACLDGAEETHAAEVVDARALRLDDGRVLRLAGIEPFDLLRPDDEDAGPLLQRRLSQLAAGRPLPSSSSPRIATATGAIRPWSRRAGRWCRRRLPAKGWPSPSPAARRCPASSAFWPRKTPRAARRAASGTAHRACPLPRPTAFAASIGHFAIFEGKVVSVGNRSARTYLNFGTRWSKDVTVEIEASGPQALRRRGGLAALAGHGVSIRGFCRKTAGR